MAAAIVLLLVPLEGQGAQTLSASGTFRVMTYNVENYLLEATPTRPKKSLEARSKVVESIVAGHPDILALQEVGDSAALQELQGRLRAQGVDLPGLEIVRSWDTNISVAVLSRFPIVRRQSHTNESFLLNGHRWHVSRGFAEVEIQVHRHYRIALLVAHLKSKRNVGAADETEIRQHEAARLRELVEDRLRASPELNLVVCGDFNDTQEALPIRTLLGEREPRLFDSRPVENNGDQAPAENPRYAPRRVAWTHFYGREDTYSRLDYILLSRGLKREWRPEQSHVIAIPDWGVGSDHRPVVCEFWAGDR